MIGADEEAGASGGGGGGSDTSGLNWRKRKNVKAYAKKHGINLANVTSWAEKQRIIKASRRG
jgi:hypothetical protein